MLEGFSSLITKGASYISVVERMQYSFSGTVFQLFQVNTELFKTIMDSLKNGFNENKT